MSATVIVDDRDPVVQYNPRANWVPEGKAIEYSGTTSLSTKTGDTASFTFEGTSVRVYGTVGNNNGDPASETMQFAIDGSSTPFSASAPPTSLHHQLLYTSPDLQEGTHTLIVTQTGREHNDVIFLDYFLYTTTSTAGKTVFIDDNDPKLHYSSGWEVGSGDGMLQNTTHTSRTVGSELSFDFEGSSIKFNGPIFPADSGNGYNASVVIDGGPSFIMTQTHQDSTTFNNLLFSSSPELAPGKHTIVITALNDQPLAIDYFLVQAHTVNASTGAATSASNSPLSQATGSAVTQSEPPLAGAQTSKPFPMAAVIGGVAGAVLLLILLLGVFGVLWWRRKARRLETDSAFVAPPTAEVNRRWTAQSAVTLTDQAIGGDLGKGGIPPRYIYYRDEP
ncbi:hypothetical protein C8R43DRAFT_1078998 [Mycena crocata]|nr:hypothetical protein C8R43DRAFT_1078998 [Mycena crocata]